jgi:hypothetical protein
MGNISYPVRLKKGAVVAFTYRPQEVAENPVPPCLGTVNEPTAEAGHMCVYRGALSFGAEEKQDKNAAFFTALDPKGENVTLTKKVGLLGELLVFRSSDFTEEGTTPAILKEATILSAGGSWAVQEK